MMTNLMSAYLTGPFLVMLEKGFRYICYLGIYCSAERETMRTLVERDPVRGDQRCISRVLSSH